MPYLPGVLTGVVLTVFVAFLIDHFGPGPDTPDDRELDRVGRKSRGG